MLKKLFFFLGLFFVLLQTSHAESPTCAELTPLNFLLLGDWGKGGNTGYTYNSLKSQIPEGSDDDVISLGVTISANENNGNNNGNAKNKQLYQAAIAKVMGTVSEYLTPSFVLALGDNFYTKGVTSSTDVYWEYLWEDVYLRDYAGLRVPWYPVFGNHDYG